MTKSVTIQKVPGTVQAAIRHSVINVVVVTVDRALDVSARHMHARHGRRGPGHLAARNRQGSPRHPAPARPGRCSAVGDALALLLGRHVVRHAALKFGVGVGGGRDYRQGVVCAGVGLGAGGACYESGCGQD